jgi:hypothetical protein
VTAEMLRSIIEANELMRLNRLMHEDQERAARRMTRADFDDYQADCDNERQYGWGH